MKDNEFFDRVFFDARASLHRRSKIEASTEQFLSALAMIECDSAGNKLDYVADAIGLNECDNGNTALIISVSQMVALAFLHEMRRSGGRDFYQGGHCNHGLVLPHLVSMSYLTSRILDGGLSGVRELADHIIEKRVASYRAAVPYLEKFCAFFEVTRHDNFNCSKLSTVQQMKRGLYRSFVEYSIKQELLHSSVWPDLTDDVIEYLWLWRVPCERQLIINGNSLALYP